MLVGSHRLEAPRIRGNKTEVLEARWSGGAAGAGLRIDM